MLNGITPFLRALVGRAPRNRIDAEDAVQDILLTVHAVRHTYDPSRPFKPWPVGIARHRLLDRLRVLGRQASREVALEPAHETFSDLPTNHDEGPDRQTLHAALRSLPESQWQAVEHRRIGCPRRR
ncbi:MAG: hypothetical protein JSR21_01540 [Proteobacteria bacterium]|nr:hypothetical protein [Pseudomonadota bacterium]